MVIFAWRMLFMVTSMHAHTNKVKWKIWAFPRNTSRHIITKIKVLTLPKQTLLTLGPVNTNPIHPAGAVFVPSKAE
ncbi:MAG: hypothetical protein DBP02_00700 [gamma proteobacterium symbiont of Ctena orbiculata]|nr:MAG: hypothetical protein DBP02_00700 [gamma proteobacterium symbiont of Ctena orbiculata]